jgi:pimeloyl-ACP methyl ester carboxylesterase
MKRCMTVSLCLFLLGVCLPLLLPGTADQPLANEAGYMAIEPITFHFHYGSHFNRLVLKSSQARIWYSFHAADQNRPNTPLFVFFNGGPGSSTSFGLMSMYTGRYTLDNQIEEGGGNVYIPNPVSWTRLGHLLYIDARQTGFSYNLMDLVYDEGERFQEFNAQNYNSFFDAADFIRVLLRFLAAHPTLQDHPVVIVGESYGGVRTTTMLHILLNYADYGNGVETFQDPPLVEEIQAHFDTVFPQYAGEVVPPEVITQQFGHQVLIQPAITMKYQDERQEEMWEQPGSPLYQIGEEVGIPYDPELYPDPYDYVADVAGRDLYIYTKPRDWLDGFFNNAGVLLRFVQNLSLVTGVDVTAISELYASVRENAYRVITTDYDLSLEPETECPITRQLFEIPARLEAPNVRLEPGNMDEVFGTLQPWDRYFIGTNYHANWAFHVWNVALVRGYDIQSWEPRYGRMFLKNVAHIHTFITNAAYDLVVYTNALPSSLGKHTDILTSVQHITQGVELRPGKIVLHYQPSAFPDIPDLTSKTIRFPIYDKSCHAVSLTQPEELFTDLSNWLQEHGIEVQ